MSTYISKTHFTDPPNNKDFLNKFPKVFLSAWEKTMKWEGGEKLHKVKGDSGGLTKWGVSQKAYPDLNIEQLTKSEAISIAYYDYWLLMHCDKIAEVSPKTASHVFDIGFNMGHKWGIKMLQRAINILNNKDILIDDGIFGNKTYTALKCVNPNALAGALRDVRIKRFQWLSAMNPVNLKFIKGWKNRANDFA